MDGDLSTVRTVLYTQPFKRPGPEGRQFEPSLYCPVSLAKTLYSTLHLSTQLRYINGVLNKRLVYQVERSLAARILNICSLIFRATFLANT